MNAVIPKEMLALIADAYAVIAENEAQCETNRQKLVDIQDELDDIKVERAHKIELEDKDAALRLVDGDDAVAPNPQRAKRIAAISSKIPALTAAIPLQRRRIAESERQLADAQPPFTAAIM